MRRSIAWRSWLFCCVLLALLRALTALPRLSLLALLALLTLLSLLTLLAGLPLLAGLVPRQLFHLLLQLFSFAAEHFLLPALLRALLFVALLLSEFLLPARKLLELLQRLIEFFLALIGGRSLCAGFVLVLLGIEFEIEETFEVAAGATTASAASPLSEGYLDLSTCGFGAQQML